MFTNEQLDRFEKQNKTKMNEALERTGNRVLGIYFDKKKEDLNKFLKSLSVKNRAIFNSIQLPDIDIQLLEVSKKFINERLENGEDIDFKKLRKAIINISMDINYNNNAMLRKLKRQYIS